MRKKGDKIINGKVVHVESNVAVIDVPIESTGINLTNSLSSDENMERDPEIYLKFKGTGAPEVTMLGRWDGRLLSCAMRSIHKKYNDVRKHACVYAMKKSQVVA